jgi:hypothetical protein
MLTRNPIGGFVLLTYSQGRFAVTTGSELYDLPSGTAIGWHDGFATAGRDRRCEIIWSKRGAVPITNTSNQFETVTSVNTALSYPVLFPLPF